MLIQYELVSIFNDLLGQQARLRKGGEQATYHCPFCPDKNPTTKKLEIAISGPKVGYFHCWRCNTKGRTFGSLLKKLNDKINDLEVKKEVEVSIKASAKSNSNNTLNNK